MTTILCDQDDRLREMIVRFAESLKTEAHRLGDHGLSERDFYQGGLFRGAIERVRGQFSASMREKREFVKHTLNFLEDGGFIRGWEAAGDANRHDYMVTLNNGRLSAIELKGCLDGNNTNIFERPPQAQEFVIWSVCSNAGASPRHNVWSGIHTRLSAEIISRAQQVDGLVVWDWLCGTVARPCPKLASGRSTLTTVGPFALPPPCIYLFPRTASSARRATSSGESPSREGTTTIVAPMASVMRRRAPIVMFFPWLRKSPTWEGVNPERRAHSAEVIEEGRAAPTSRASSLVVMSSGVAIDP